MSNRAKKEWRKTLATLTPTEEILINGRKLKIRPFNVKHLVELRDADSRELPIKTLQAVSWCVFDKMSIDELTAHDVELITMTARKLSTPKLKHKYVCQCGKENTVSAYLNHVHIKENDLPSAFTLNQRLSLEMRKPTLIELIHYEAGGEIGLANLVMRCVKSLTIEGTKQVVGVDVELQELGEMFEYLDVGTFRKMAEYVSDMPEMILPIPVVCECGNQDVHTLYGSEIFE
ncbi:hypothetical protein ACWM6O_000950 [Vibrio vulnificus]